MDTNITLQNILEQSAVDIYKRGADEQKCISGNFKMCWKLPGKIEAIASVSISTREEHSIGIVFELNRESTQMLDLVPHDEFRLSLRGVIVKKLQNIPKLFTLPLQLVFSKSVHIQWRRQGPNELRRELNTWSLNIPAGDVEQSNSWFPSQRGAAHYKRSLSKGREDDIKEETKKIKKQKRAEAKKHKAAGCTTDHTLLTAVDVGARQSASTSHQDFRLITRATESTRPQDTLGEALNSTISFSAPIDPMWTSNNVCTPLAEIQAEKLVTIIGVVTSMSAPSKSSTGGTWQGGASDKTVDDDPSLDWMRLMYLVDPTNHNTHSSGLKINCFTKRHKEWLPHPEEGEVLILRNVKIREYHGALSGVGYADKLQWAAFSPSKGEIHHGPPSAAPEQEGLAEGGFGVTFSPFLQPGALQTIQCVKISDWWRNVSNQAYTGESTQDSYRRVHRLLSEAGPSVPPNGYFDCTIEVLQGCLNSNGQVYTLYVTDYTRNEQMMGVQANWCPALLSDLVVQFEMWDEAAVIAKTMRPGQYYAIKNARMVTNPKGFPEGKVRETKILQLTEDHTNHHLQALLERKRLWEAKHRSSESDIKYKLVRDAREREFFHCTVELLLVVSDPKRRPCIYVTDYTAHPLLADADVPGLRGLRGYILKIMLSDQQEELAKTLSIGSYYCIRKVRVKYSTVDGCFCGFLGGSERLIIQLNPNNTANESLNGLLRRRESWQRSQTRGEGCKINALPLTDGDAMDGDETSSFMSIKDIISTKLCPGRCRVYAKPVDFYPLNIRDAFYQRCRQCKAEISKSARACFKCGDFEHEHVQYFYQLYVSLRDQEDNEMIVSIDDKCPLLNGLERLCIQDNGEAFSQFYRRVEPLIGSLTKMHDALESGKRIDVNTSMYCFDIESWLISDAKKAFRLIAYSPV